MDRGSKFTGENAKLIVSQMYVAKNIGNNTAKTIKFIVENRKYFPDISDSTIKQLMDEKKLTQEDIDKEKCVNIIDINNK